MPDALTITPGFLRQAIRDARYWREGRPERQAYAEWVTDPFRALHATERQGRASGPVQVRAYVRHSCRLDRPQQVSAHIRGRPQGVQRVAYRPRDERGLPAPLGTRPEPQIGGGAPLPSSTPALRPSPSTVDGLRAGARLEKDVASRIYDRGGGVPQLRSGFEALGPTGLRTYRDGAVTVGELPGGNTAIMRTRSSDGRPTLEIQPASGGPASKFRY